MQTTLFNQQHTAFGIKEVPNKVFSQPTYEPEKDKERLANALKAIHQVMSDGGWWTVEELADKIGNRNHSSISAQIRNLRKLGFVVERRNRNGIRGLSEYKI